MRGSPWCESTTVSPWPGKCLAHAATPVDCSPSTNAAECRATRSGSSPKLRTPMTGLSGEEFTSTLGARSSPMPSPASSLPMAAAVARVSTGSSSRPSTAFPGTGDPPG